jgi:DNA processing protein
MNYVYYEVLESLLNKYHSLSNIWNLDIEELHNCNCLEEKIIKELLNTEYRKNLKRYLEYMEKYGISMVTCYDSDYPKKLRNIQNRPIVLFYKGDISIVDEYSIAIVGSRNCSDYGRKCANFISNEIAIRKICIVSGLAIGIDSIGHIAALNNKSNTIAIIGNGLDNIYPSKNKKLAESIIKNGGLIISEFVVGTKPFKQNFPRRNRIISGLSDSVIVIEGSKKSGSLITAGYAIEQGKEVFVVPGSIFSPNSEGTNELIKDGANLLTSTDDVIRTIDEMSK